MGTLGRSQLRTIQFIPWFPLPNINCAYVRRAGAISDDLCFEHDLYVLSIPIARHPLQYFLHPLLVHQEFSGGDSAAAADACADDH